MKPAPSPTSRTLLVALLALALAAVPAAAQKKRGKKTFADTTSVVVVEVPVTVTRDGEPVDDLTAANFEVLDGKKKQEITGFELIDLKKIETFDPLERPIPIAARRHFLMFFDLAWSRPELVVKARRAARDLVDDLHPTDLAGVAVYTPTRGANLLLNFTSDRRQLELAIETLGVPELIERTPDPLGLVLGNLDVGLATPTPLSTGTGSVIDESRQGGRQQSDEIQRIENERILDAVNRLTAAERTAQLNNISAFAGNLEALADLMAPIEGRKHLVYFSEGIPSDLVVGQETTIEQTQQRAGLSVADAELKDSDTMFGATRAQNELEGMIEQFRRAGCVIQSVDIGGVRAAGEIRGRKAGEDSLISMAKSTGGEFFRNFNDLGDAMEKMLERTSVTYLLAFQPQNLKIDGAYHRLKVKLVDAPRGARLSHRAGYYAPKPFEAIGARQRNLKAAEIIMSNEDGGPVELDVMAAAFPVKGAEAYVPVLLEVDGRSLLAGSSEDVLELELYAYATDTKGGVYDFFVANLRFDLARARGALEQSGFKYWGHFDLPPGNYTARVMVRDKSDGRYSLRRQAVTVPAFDNSEALLLPPMFPEPPNKWMMIREGEERRRDVDYPFMAAGEPYIPAAKPVVPAKGATPFYLQGINLAAGVEFGGEVMSAEGTPVEGAALQLGESTAGDGVRMVMAQLQTRGLKPGEYTLVGKATDATGEPHSCSIRFVVR